VIDKSGLFDNTYQGFLSPADPGRLTWGAGWALQIPLPTKLSFARSGGRGSEPAAFVHARRLGGITHFPLSQDLRSCSWSE